MFLNCLTTDIFQHTKRTAGMPKLQNTNLAKVDQKLYGKRLVIPEQRPKDHLYGWSGQHNLRTVQ